MKADYQQWQPQLNAVGTLRAVRGVDVTTEIAGLVRSVDFKSGDEVKAGPGAGPAQRRLRHRAAALAGGRSRARGDGLRARQGAARRGSDQQGAGRRRRRRPEEQAGAGRAAGGAGRQEDDPRAVRRQARHQHGQSGTVPQPRRQAGDAADDRPDLRRLLSAAAAVAADRARAEGDADRDAYKGQTFDGKVNAINPRSTRDAQRADRSDGAEPEAPAAARHVRHRVKSNPAASSATSPCRRRRSPSTPTATPCSSSRPSDKKDEKGNPQLVAQQVFVTTGPTRGDQVAILKGIEPGTQVVTSGQVKLKNGTPLVIDNTVQPANSPNPTPQEK